MIEAEYKAQLTDADAVGRSAVRTVSLATSLHSRIRQSSLRAGRSPSTRRTLINETWWSRSSPKIDGTFLELETHVDTTDDLDGALADLRTVPTTLGVSPDQFTSDQHSLLTAPAPGRDASALLDIQRRGPYPANRGCYRDCGRFGQWESHTERTGYRWPSGEG